MKRTSRALKLVSIEARTVIQPVPLSATPQLRVQAVHYAAGMACPDCGGRAFHVGRHAAECARCATALPLAPAGCR